MPAFGAAELICLYNNTHCLAGDVLVSDFSAIGSVFVEGSIATDTAFHRALVRGHNIYKPSILRILFRHSLNVNFLSN